MYVISEPDYATTNWYQNSISALKNQARKKRVQLFFVSDVAETRGEACAFVLGASVAWIVQTVAKLQETECHPILLNELPDYPFLGRYSCVKTDYNRFMSALAARFEESGRMRTAFYGMNPASFSDISRKNAFEACFSGGAIFENNGSLGACFEQFYRMHRERAFDSVICANDFAAVSLLTHLRACDEDSTALDIAVHSNAQILTRFPKIQSVSVDYSSVASAAFQIADCIAANPSFAGMRITVDPQDAHRGDSFPESRMLFDMAEGAPSDPLYLDGELNELMRIEKLLSACDETDLQILRLLKESGEAIGESTFLSDNGVKYRIKKMKKVCGVDSKSEIPKLLEKYGVEL